MIRNETEYKEAVQNVKNEQRRLLDYRKSLKQQGLKPDQVERAMEPLESFHLQLREEVETYEHLKQGRFEEISNLQGIGLLLISLRIAKGITQRELAKRLNVSESQISRDERNEYHGITLDRASKVLDALGAKLKTSVVSIQSEVPAAV